ncbi:hypothetical protein LAZ67_8000969 [Cordylochernes scorpioides]|uniref:Reverse transcriptase domain-containing protein n=1 Tax=Cordylochernes scorpioides TaxID=51811 RepID=A0ABY6KRE6_9ARAC|nr:hypothetical protein LAZ67_8000969 [Cordylochernes scorpioides]
MGLIACRAGLILCFLSFYGGHIDSSRPLLGAQASMLINKNTLLISAKGSLLVVNAGDEGKLLAACEEEALLFSIHLTANNFENTERNTTSKSQINSPPHNQITESYYDINTCKYDSQDDDKANFSENSRDIAEKIICWNINGFYRILSIFPLLEHIKNYEIFALLETWCLNRTNITLKDYQIIELPATKESGRGRGSGGIIVGFREGGKYRVDSSEKDGTWLSIFLSTNTRALQHVICLIFVYLPPNQIQLHNLDKLFTYIQKQIADGKEIILLGDLNIRTGKLEGLHNPLNFQLPLTLERRAKDHIISSLSNKLLDFLEDNSLTIVNGRSRSDKDGDFTYISERGSSTIDYCILSQGSLQILLDFKVDDQLYSDHHPLVLTIKGQNFNEKKTKQEDYNITRYRWSADGLAMFKMKLEELREKNIPASDDLVYTFNQQILEAMSSAKITYSIKGGPRKSKPWFDKDCYDMKKLAKESLKKYRKTNRLEDRECYASSRKKHLALLDLKRKGFDNEKQEILRNAKDSKTFWKTIALYKSTSIIQGEISIQDWLNFYQKNLRICNLHNVISQNDPILGSEITNADIYKEIAGLKSNKACGPDGIPNEVLKTLPDSYILLLKQLYNSVMTTGKYPAIWTNSTIHPIFKNGYKNSPFNYRGIALISNVSKLFTSILRSRLEEWVEGRRRGKLNVFFVDLRKAFDTVPHSILWKKLYNLGISYQFISTIRSYYEQATIAIRWKGSFTESIKINSGVLQGEPLSPLLFILFITDLIEIYNNSDLPSVNLPEFGDIHLLLYADDIAIIGESRMNLQKKIKILKEYLDENLMTLNESKSKIMVFHNGANYFKGKTLTAINATHPILIKSKAKSINLSIKLFDTIVRAVLMYAAPLWATEHKDLLDNIQDIFIRRFLNLPRYTPGYLIRLETGRISLSVTALKITLKYWLRVLNMSSDRLPRICFNRTRELSNASGTPIGFIKKLTNLLNNNGSPALVSCDDPETLRSAITGLLKTAADQSIQNDLTRMDKSKLYSHYKDIHISFMTDGYLLEDFPFPVVRLLAQVRIPSSFFRENHTKMLCGEDPTCTFCNSKLKNEITHYIFDCPALKEEPLCSKLGNSVLHFHQ